MDSTTLFFGVIFGAIGASFFVYGKRQGRPVYLLSGIALVVSPYLVSAPWGLGILGTVLAFLPYLAGRWWGW